MCFAGASAPAGWLFCDGSEVLQNDYLDLFNVIQNNYGTASVSTNFVLPNLQEKMAIGKSGSNNLGNHGGNQSITLTEGQMPSHSHTGTTSTDGTHSHTSNATGGLGGTGLAFSNGYDTTTSLDTSFNQEINLKTTVALSINDSGSHSHTFTTSTTGSGSSINIMNPYVVLNYLIKF
jgi:microcystin-dependent protein